MKLWLDDERLMPQGFDRHVTTAAEAIRLFAAGGIKRISLDHDLGPPENGTGYEVACFIEEATYNGNLQPLEVTIHSVNPVGRENMQRALAKANLYWQGFCSHQNPTDEDVS